MIRGRHNVDYKGDSICFVVDKKKDKVAFVNGWSSDDEKLMIMVVVVLMMIRMMIKLMLIFVVVYYSDNLFPT